MANFVKPRYTNSRIRAAGKRISKSKGSFEDNIVLENFRASHAYILNTFQANIRNHARNLEKTVGQRLKRRATIIDKLKREPNMPLSSMHDIAGCRIVLKDIDSLNKVRNSMRNARWRHYISHEEDKYDYINNPKSTGYRGIHDVYTYKVLSAGGQPYNDLKIEVQFRTQSQHAWATAVEVADLITSNRIKFSEASEYYLEYFQLASEIIARSSEKSKSCLPLISDKELVRNFSLADKRLGLMQTLDNLRSTTQRNVKFKKNSLLIFRFGDGAVDSELEILTFDNVNRAIETYDELEKKYGTSADIVLVRGESEENIRSAFRNYFSDARAFVDLINDGISYLS